MIATGETNTVRRCVEIAFDQAGLEWEPYVKIDDAFKRPGRGRPAGRRSRQGQGAARLGAADELRGADPPDGRRGPRAALALTSCPTPPSWQGRRVWLTGHTGFKGAWLALWLQSLGAEVYGFSAGPVGEPSLYEVAGVADGMAGDVRGDVRSKGEVRAAIARARPDVVFHLAAQALVRRGLAKPVETFTVNVTGTAKVLEALRAEASPGRRRRGDERQVLPQRRQRPGVPRGRPARRRRPVLGLQGRPGAHGARRSARSACRSPPCAPATRSAAATGRPTGSSPTACARRSPASP